MTRMSQIGRRQYVVRHAYNALPHLTTRKILNLALNAFERHHKVPSPRSLPVYMKIEPTAFCQLKCLGCHHRDGDYKRQHPRSMQMSLDDFKRVLDPVSSSLLGISLSYTGEPLMHDDLPSLIAYAHKKNVAVSFPSNLSMRLDESFIDRLVKSGLDSLFVSLDGASEETYGKYRVGGNLRLVLGNVRAIADAKKRNGLKRPRLVWKFVVFDHNEHELETVRRTYRGLGFDDWELDTDCTSAANHDERRAFIANLRERQMGCYWPWHSITVGWNGDVFPCCVSPGNFDLGNAVSQDTKAIWQSDAFRSLRQGFSVESQMHILCRKCLGYPLAVSAGGQDVPGTHEMAG